MERTGHRGKACCKRHLHLQIGNKRIYRYETNGIFEIDADAIQLKLNVEDVLLIIDTAIPCGLIINKLVSNALKYAFPKGEVGEIRIEFRKIDDSKYTLIVSDNGVGVPKELDFRNTESLGLQLVSLLTDQLGGIVELNRKRGTTFNFTFNLINS